MKNIINFKNKIVENYLFIFKNKDYLYIFLISGGTALLSAMLVPIFPLWILNKVKLSVSSVFFLISIIGVGSAVLNVCIGHFSDVIGKRKIVIEISLILSSIRGVLYCFFPYVGVIIAASWLTQVSNGSLLFALLSDKIKENDHQEREGLINSTVRTSVSIGYIIGPWIGVTITSYLSYSVFFLFYGLIYLILFFIVKLKVNDKAVLIKEKQVAKSKLVTKSNVLLLTSTTLLIVCLFAGSMGSSSLLVLYISDISKLSWMLAAVFGIGPIFEIIIFPLVGMLNDKIGTVKTLILGAVGEIVYFIFLFMSSNAYVILIVQVFGTFYTAVLFSSLLIYIQGKFKNREGFSSSIYFSSISISSVLTNALIGALLINWGYSYGFLLFAGTSFVGLVLILLLETNFRMKVHITSKNVEN